MGRIDYELGRIASGQNRIVTTDQLRDRGLSRNQINWLLASGRLTRVHRGVHLYGGGPLGFEEQATALCLAVPNAVLSHASAGYLYGIRKSARDRLEITIPTDERCLLPRVKVHRSNRLDPEDIFHRLDGIRLTSPERLLFDQAAVLDGDELLSAAHDAIHRELVSPASLLELGARMVGRGRRGSADFARIVAGLDGDQPPAESDGELKLAAAAEAAGVPDLQRQVWVQLPTGAYVRIDVASAPVRLALEYDHSFWHAIPARVQADKSRDVHLQRVRWTTLRFTELDLAHPAAVVQAIREIYLSRLRALAA